MSAQAAGSGAFSALSSTLIGNGKSLVIFNPGADQVVYGSGNAHSGNISMALKATMYSLEIHLADVDRSVYEQVDLRIAMQPSETVDYMFLRVLAFCLEYGEGISLTEGVAAGDEPAVLIRDLTGKINAWIEVGMPPPDRLHRGHKLAGRAAVYTDRTIKKLLDELAGAKVHRVSDIPVYAFKSGFVEEVARLLERRSRLSLTITERELYLEVDGRSFATPIAEHRAK